MRIGRRRRRRFFEDQPFLDSSAFHRIQREKRRLRKILFAIKGVEPRSKNSMPKSDKDEVQRQLLARLQEYRRRAFRGPLALSMLLTTTDTTPSYSHNIAKNLLDLFSKPRPNIKTRRAHLLYTDDEQVHGLCVICKHGYDRPNIYVDARPLGVFLADLDIARQQVTDDDEDDSEISDAVGEFRRVLRNGPAFWDRFGANTYETMRRWHQRHAQEALLNNAAVSVTDLAYLYGVGMSPLIGDDITRQITRMFSGTPLRVQLSELPQATGTSNLYKAEIDAKLREFKKQFNWIIEPVLVPIAMEVVVKPPPDSRRRAKHDLDNVVRSYLLPRVFEIIKPLSDHSFTYDVDAVQKALGLPSVPRPPLSTRIGVTRYEAWRLPPAADTEKGFVSVAIVADTKGPGSIFQQVDEAIDHWEESLENDY